MKSFKTLLHASVLTDHYTSLSPLGEMWATKKLWGSGPAVDSITDEIEQVQITATATASKANLRDGKANVIQTTGAGKIRIGMVRQFDVLPLGVDALTALREIDSPTIQAKGMQVLRMQLERMATMQANFLEIFFSHVLNYHRVNLSADFSLLQPSVHATTGVITDHADTVISLDFGHAAAHRGQCGTLFSDAWSDPDTRIDIQLDELKREARRNGLPVPTEIAVNGVNKGVLRTNTEFRTWCTNNGARMESILQGEGIQGLWGFNWQFVDGTYTDSAGDEQEIVPEEVAIISPAMSGQWVKRFNGMELVNLSGQLSFANAAQALASLSEVYGKFAYARIQENPAQILAYAGNNFGVGFAAPALWTPTVFPS